MYKKPKNQNAADNHMNGSANGLPEPGANLPIGDFELWLELQLIELEAKYESFATVNSTRNFFNHSSR